MNKLIENHNSLGHEQPSGLDAKQSPNVQDAFWPCQADLIMFFVVDHPTHSQEEVQASERCKWQLSLLETNHTALQYQLEEHQHK